MSPIHPAATRGLLGGWTGWPGRWLRAAWVARWCHPFLRFGGRYGLAVAAVALAGGLRWAFTAWAGPGLAFSTICYPAVMIAALLGGFGPGLLASALATLGAAGLGSPGERPGLLLFLGLGLFTSAVAEFYRRSRDRAAAGSRATAMAEHRELLATIVAHSPAAICVIRGSDLRIQLINSAYQAIAPGKPMLGRTMDEVWPEIQRPLAELFRRVLATGEPHLELNTPFTIARQEGAPVETAYFSWSLHRFRLPGENGWALLNTAWETTQQNLAENRLRELSQELSYHVDNSPLAVIEWGPDMRLTRWSGEAERIFGWTAGEVLGKRMEEFRWVYREDLDQVAEVSRELRTGTNSQRFSANRNYRKDGTVVHCEWYNSSLLDASGRLRSILSLVLDVTERERMEARLKEEAQHKDDFLALLGHELRNPLAPIGNAVHLLRQAGQDPDLAGRACAIIDRQVAHMARLVDDLLDVSRITRGLVQLQKQEIDLVVTVGSALGDYQPVLAASAQTLAASLPERPIWIQADRARIVQVVCNLLQNAGKFTDPGGRIEVAVGQDEPGWAWVRVKDSGIGIPPDQLGSIFEPFVQQKETIGRSRGGLGLGLALVRGLAELHGGAVAAHSEGPGRGSAFTVRLPVAPAAAPPAGPSPGPGPGAGRSRRILIIEDLADAALTLQLLLQMLGHSVEVAGDGTVGLAKALRFQPEIVLCDIGLPGQFDGYGVARALRAQPGLAGAYLIAMTGFGSPADKDRAEQAGFDAHLTKPVDPAGLAPLIAGIPARDSG